LTDFCAATRAIPLRDFEHGFPRADSPLARIQARNVSNFAATRDLARVQR
jgi:hypothetical protein